MKPEIPNRPRRRRLSTKSQILLDGCQFKSIEIARDVARGLDLIEKGAGIHSVIIAMDQCFICPDIDLDQLNQTPMEIVLQSVMRQQLKANRERNQQP